MHRTPVVDPERLGVAHLRGGKSGSAGEDLFVVSQVTNFSTRASGTGDSNIDIQIPPINGVGAKRTAGGSYRKEKLNYSGIFVSLLYLYQSPIGNFLIIRSNPRKSSVDRGTNYVRIVPIIATVRPHYLNRQCGSRTHRTNRHNNRIANSGICVVGRVLDPDPGTPGIGNVKFLCQRNADKGKDQQKGEPTTQQLFSLHLNLPEKKTTGKLPHNVNL
jgi:hypothetical protein